MAGVEVNGLPQLVHGLEAAAEEMRDLDVFPDIAQVAADYAQQRTPRKSGALRATVRPSALANEALVTFGSPTVRYAGPILGGWPARSIKAARTIPETTDYLTTRAPHMVEQGLTDTFNRLGLD